MNLKKIMLKLGVLTMACWAVLAAVVLPAAQASVIRCTPYSVTTEAQGCITAALHTAYPVKYTFGVYPDEKVLVVNNAQPPNELSLEEAAGIISYCTREIYPAKYCYFKGDKRD